MQTKHVLADLRFWFGALTALLPGLTAIVYLLRKNKATAGLMAKADKVAAEVIGAESKAHDVLHEAADALRTIEPALPGNLRSMADQLATSADQVSAALAPPPPPPALLITADPGGADGTAQAAAATALPAVKTAVLVMLLGVAAMFACGGCGTSRPFRTGVAIAGPDFADEETAYVMADKSIDPATRANRLGDASALAQAAAQPEQLEPVADAWSKVEPPYLGYVTTDATLDPDERQLRVDNCQRMDDLIAAERGRPAPFGEGGN